MMIFDDDEDDDLPLYLHEELGDHTLNDDIRKALVWASIHKFLTGTLVNEDEFEEKHKVLAKSVVFHGPFDDFDEAVKESQQRKGIVVAPKYQWTEEEQPVWLACLAN